MTSFTLSSDDWLTRETQFAAFATGPLLDFWRLREEGEFSGVDGVPIRFVRFRSARHQRVVVVSPGRIESYVKYPEVAYDLFHCGYDVVIVDHRGRALRPFTGGYAPRSCGKLRRLRGRFRAALAARGRIARLSAALRAGAFDGRRDLAQFLQRRPQAFDAAAFCAPMFGIQLPMPVWLADRILDWAESRPAIRDYYAVGTGQWRPLPYVVNVLTHSRERYRRSLRYYADYPELQVGGPTYHWVRESIRAGRQIIAQAGEITTPLLLLQAGEERVVDNRSHQAFCQALSDAGHPCEGGSRGLSTAHAMRSCSSGTRCAPKH